MRNRYLLNEHGHQMTARQVIEAVFPGKQYGTKVPSNVSGETHIGDVYVSYLTTENAKQVIGGKRGMYMRARAICPDCKREFAASRLNQHNKVHQRWSM